MIGTAGAVVEGGGICVLAALGDHRARSQPGPTEPQGICETVPCTPAGSGGGSVVVVVGATVVVVVDAVVTVEPVDPVGWIAWGVELHDASSPATRSTRPAAFHPWRTIGVPPSGSPADGTR